MNGNNKKYKILQVHNYYQIPGGEDTVVANEKKLLEENGHMVIQYTRHNSELNHFSIFRKLLLPVTTLFNPKTYWDVRKIIKRKQIDIVHVHNTLSLISPSVYYAAINSNVPVVQTVHNFRLLCPGAAFYRDGHICEDCISKGLRCAVKHGCYRQSKVQTLVCVINTLIHRKTGIYAKLNYICLTEFNKKKLLNLKQINKERVFIKPNFVNDMLKPCQVQQVKNQFIFVGRLDRLKGIDLLFEAWRQLELQMGSSTPKLLVCGTGPLENWCITFIHENHMQTVEMRGFVSNDKVRNLISTSKALILPTRWYEGFPMTIVEAFSVGTPVIGPDMGNVGDLIINGINGVTFNIAKPDELVWALLRVHAKPFRVNKAIVEKYSSECNYVSIYNIYHNCRQCL